MIEALAAALGLSIAAFAVAGWLVNRRRRADFLAKLSVEERRRFDGFESLMGWRGFRELLALECEQAALLRPRLDSLNLARKSAGPF